jgi:Ca2+/Na+ antiporter
MLRDVFKTMGDIEIYGMISTIIFVVFFVLLVLYTIAMKKSDMDEFSNMPLDEFTKKSDEIQDR